MTGKRKRLKKYLEEKTGRCGEPLWHTLPKKKKEVKHLNGVPAFILLVNEKRSSNAEFIEQQNNTAHYSSD